MDKIINYVETTDDGKALVALSYDELQLISSLLKFHTANWVNHKQVRELLDKVFVCKEWLKEHF